MSNARRAIFLGLLAVTLVAQAQPPVDSTQAGNERFAEKKQLELGKISQRLQTLQALQSCVQAAQDKPAIKKCHESARLAKQAQDKKR